MWYPGQSMIKWYDLLRLLLTIMNLNDDQGMVKACLNPSCFYEKCDWPIPLQRQYWKCLSEQNWNDANNVCRLNNARLLVVELPLDENIQNLGDVWLGCKHISDIWMCYGKPLQHELIPNPRNEGDDCLILANDKTTHARKCDQGQKYVCQRDLNTISSTTTDAQTTHAVTTDAQTTDAITTHAVTTDAQTTHAVTTDAQTTDAITTHAQTTHAVTTDAQTTDAITTHAVTTDAQTTHAVTTDAQTTHAITTHAVTTDAQTTHAVTTDAQTTHAVTTDAQTTHAVTTDAQTTASITTEVSSQRSIVTNPSVNIDIDVAVDVLQTELQISISEDDFTTKTNETDFKHIESEEYAIFTLSVRDNFDFDMPVGDSMYHVDFPPDFQASWVSVGVQKEYHNTSFWTNISSTDDSYILGSHILSVSLFSNENKHISYSSKDDPVKIIFEMQQSLEKNEKPVCSYFDLEKKLWSEEGCELATANTSHVACNIYHLSSFAVLIQVADGDISAENKLALELLTYICLPISIVCLILTLVVFGVFRLYKKPRIIIHSNLALSLLIVYLTFIAGLSPKTMIGCKTVAVMLHYFLLVTFMWMLFEGVHLYLKVCPTIKLTMRMPVCMGIAWGLPLVIAVISVAIRHDVYKDSPKTGCFLPLKNGVIFAFIAPAAFVFLVNIVILILSMKTFLSLKANQDKTEAQRVKALLRAILILTPILGVTWILGFLQYEHSSSTVFTYLFTIFNSLQGAFLFLTQCVMDDEVRKCFKQRFGKIGGRVGSTDDESKSANTTNM